MVDIEVPAEGAVGRRAGMTPRRPNVLWISTHDINPDLGCYTGVWPQAGQARTPNLDRLAGDGIRFDQAFAAAPVCGPSRSAILTGCFPPAIGTMHMRTLATTLAARADTCDGDSPPGQPSRKSCQSGRSNRMSAVRRPSYSP